MSLHDRFTSGHLTVMIHVEHVDLEIDVFREGFTTRHALVRLVPSRHSRCCRRCQVVVFHSLHLCSAKFKLKWQSFQSVNVDQWKRTIQKSPYKFLLNWLSQRCGTSRCARFLFHENTNEKVDTKLIKTNTPRGCAQFAEFCANSRAP